LYLLGFAALLTDVSKGPEVLERLTDVLKGRGFNSLRKNSGFDFVLKGRGFKPRRKCQQINPALAAEAAPPIAMSLFQQPVQPLGYALNSKITFSAVCSSRAINPVLGNAGFTP
jgi:hypothetical protein